jgi:hypothetical protein
MSRFVTCGICRVFAFIQEPGKFNAVILFVVIRFETYLFAEQKYDVFLHRRIWTVNLKSVIVKREAAAIVRLAIVFGGEQGVKVEVRGNRRKGGFIPARRLPVKLTVEFPDETRQGGGEPAPC